MRLTHRPFLALTATFSLLAVGLPASAQQVYQWKDAQGVTHYSDKPPARQQYQDRRIDSHGGPAPVAQPAGKPTEDPQCTQARKNLQLLSGSGPVVQNGADGKPGQPLDATQRANQRALAEAAEKAYCAPPAR